MRRQTCNKEGDSKVDGIPVVVTTKSWSVLKGRNPCRETYRGSTDPQERGPRTSVDGPREMSIMICFVRRKKTNTDRITTRGLDFRERGYVV